MRCCGERDIDYPPGMTDGCRLETVAAMTGFSVSVLINGAFAIGVSVSSTVSQREINLSIGN